MSDRLEMLLTRDGGDRTLAHVAVPVDISDNGQVRRESLEEAIAALIGTFIRDAEQTTSGPIIDDGRQLDETERAIVAALRQRTSQ